MTEHSGQGITRLHWTMSAILSTLETVLYHATKDPMFLKVKIGPFAKFFSLLVWIFFLQNRAPVAPTLEWTHRRFHAALYFRSMSLRMIRVPVILGILLLLYLLKPNTKPFHVDINPVKMMKMGFDIFPLIHFMMSVMPDSMRKKSVTKQVSSTYLYFIIIS